MAKISILAAEDCVSSGITGVIDFLAIANMWWKIIHNSNPFPLFESEIITADGKPVFATGGIPLYPNRPMGDVSETDVIVLPSFFPPFNLKNNAMRSIYEWLRASYDRGIGISAICTGTFVLAETGLLDGKIATTNWQFARIFQKEYPDVNLRINEILTEDSNLICTGAATAFLNLCLHLIEKFGSRELTAVCAKAMLIDQDRAIQAPYIIYDFYKNHKDDQILKAQLWLEDNFSEKFSMDTLAGEVGLSPRHFKRRFKQATDETPLSYLQHIRIEVAKRHLENSMDTVNEITWKVGYEDINSFRRLFKKHTGVSPKEYRKKFSAIRKN